MIAFRLAMVQLAVGKDKAKNVQHACQMVRNAAQKGANMVVLPVRYIIDILYLMSQAYNPSQWRKKLAKSYIVYSPYPENILSMAKSGGAN